MNYKTWMIGLIIPLGLWSEASSITDSQPEYKRICLLASQEDAVFQTFRQEGPYMYYLGEPNGEIHQQVSAFILRLYPEIFKKSPELLRLDEVGDPLRYSSIDNLVCSPVLMRYVAVGVDLLRYFLTIDDLDVVEIGGGFGGQCFVLQTMFRPKSYTIIDIPEALALQKRVLSHLGMTNVRYLTPEEAYNGVNCDFVLSNYAFSECNQQVQELYMRHVLANSQSGYMIMNQIASQFRIPAKNKELLVQQLCKLQPNCKEHPEFVSTHPKNYTLIW